MMSMSKSDRNMSSIGGSPRITTSRKASYQYIFKDIKPTSKALASSHKQDVASPLATAEKKVHDRPENKTEN